MMAQKMDFDTVKEKEKKVVVEEIKKIRRSIESGGDVKEIRKEFHKIVRKIKLYEITSDEVLDEVCIIRNWLISKWRPRQHSVASGLILWTVSVCAGTLTIYSSYLFSSPPTWTNILYAIPQFSGWWLINMGVHNLGHYVAGKIVGINFNSWVTRVFKGQWALIIDYKSYLRSTFTKREILHVAGPICTLSSPWIIFFVTLNPVILAVAVFMSLTQVSLAKRKMMDFGRFFRERKLKSEHLRLKKEGL